MADPVPLRRDQIARFVGNDPDAIRAIERLFQVAGDETPGEIVDISVTASVALSLAQSVLSQLLQLTDDVAPVTRAPVEPEDVPEATRAPSVLDGLADVDAPSPEAQDVLDFNGTEWVATNNVTLWTLLVRETLSFGGGLVGNVTTVSGTSYAPSSEFFIRVDDDTAGSDVTISLPEASTREGVIYHIKKLGTTGNVILQPDGVETIDGATSETIYTQHESRQVIARAGGWDIV